MHGEADADVNPFRQGLLDLTQMQVAIWDELELSAGQPQQPWGLGVLGTLDTDAKNKSSRPELRMLVLRRAERKTRSLIWHTDQRSQKVEQLHRNAQTSILFWNPAYRVQLNLHGETEVIQSVKVIREEWNNSQLTSRRAYLGHQAPGTKNAQMSVNFPEEFTTQPPTETESEPGIHNFCVLKTIVQEMDLLVLRQSGNVRATFHWESEAANWNAAWICP